MNITGINIAAVGALWKREILKFVRDRGRVIGAIGQPIGFWLVLGLGLNASFQSPAGDNEAYLSYLFPGIVLLTVLFTALFATISIVEERRSGFLQAAAVAPVPRSALLLGTLSGGVSLALAEALLFLAAAPLVGYSPGFWGYMGALGVCALASIAFTALGLVIAWRIGTTRAFHGIMNVVILPLWLLSGAPFPVDGAHPVLAAIMKVNPVTHILDAMRVALAGTDASHVLPIGWSVAVSAAFGLALFVLGLRIVRNAPPPAA